jgi:hypothetical protein
VVVDDELTVMMILFWREEEVSYTSLEYWIVELFFFIWRCGIPTLYVFPPFHYSHAKPACDCPPTS